MQTIRLTKRLNIYELIPALNYLKKKGKVLSWQVSNMDNRFDCLFETGEKLRGFFHKEEQEDTTVFFTCRWCAGTGCRSCKAQGGHGYYD